MARIPVPGDNQDQVLLFSRRRCCVCFGLHGDLSVKPGQIAHLDHNNTNSDPDNLAFLCLPHHDQYDGKTSQSKALRQSEVRHFRRELYDKIAAGLSVEPNPQQNKEAPAKPQPLPPESKPQPNIKFVETRDADVYPSDDTLFHETQCGLGEFKVTIVCFRNEGVEGQRVPSVDVRAHVIYRDAAGQEITDVPSGVWLEEYKGHTGFTLGTKKCLILFLLTDQGTLKKLWKEAYRHAQSWMSGLPSYRVRDEAIHGQVATLEIQLLSEFTDICVLKKVFEIGEYEDGVLPKLIELNRDFIREQKQKPAPMAPVAGNQKAEIILSSAGVNLTRDVTEITLEAHYINRDSQRLTFPCRSVSELPGKYDDDTSADGSVMRSTIEHPAVVVKGIDAKAVEALGWNPTRLLFKDAKTGKSKEFSGEIAAVLEPDILKFAILHRSNVAVHNDSKGRKRLEFNDLADAILSLARQLKEKHRDANAFSESLFCQELNETPERIARAMDTLVDRGRARHTGGTGLWLLFP